MIWGMTLNPGEEYLHEVFHQQHLTLASLDCRPGKSYDGSHPNSCLLLKTGNGEHVLCSLEKGLMHQQNLNLILHQGEKLTFLVEGTGTVYITGYSARHPEDIDGVPDEMSAELSAGQREETGGLDEASETASIGDRNIVVNTRSEFLSTPVKTRHRKVNKNETEELRVDHPYTTTEKTDELEKEEEDEESEERTVTVDGELSEDHAYTTTEKTDELVREEKDEESEERTVSKDEELSKDHAYTTTEKTDELVREEEDEESEERTVSKDGELKEDHPNTRAEMVDSVERQDEDEGSTERAGIQISLIKSVSPWPTKCSPTKPNSHNLGDLYPLVGLTRLKPIQLNTDHDSSSNQVKKPLRKQRHVTKHSKSENKVLVKGRLKKENQKKPVTKLKRKKLSIANVAKKQTCQICFKEVVDVGKHLRRMHVDNFETFKCRFCHAHFFQDHNRQKHEEALACKHLRLKCRFCNKVADARSQLVLHERSHTGEKPFKCNICGKTFGYKNVLKTHIMLHTGEKPFQCQFCDKKFLQKGQCASHERTHTGEKPFTCEICKRSFSVQGAYAFHKLTHSKDRERPFGCRFCQERFYRKEHVKKHELIHTSERRFKCRTCGEPFSFQKELKEHKLNKHTDL